MLQLREKLNLVFSDDVVDDIVNIVQKNRHGLIRVVYDKGYLPTMIAMAFWATVKGKKRIECNIDDEYKDYNIRRLKFITPGKKEWRSERKYVYQWIAPEINERLKRFGLYRCARQWGLDLRIREGEHKGETISDFEVIDRNDRLQMFVVKSNRQKNRWFHEFFLITRAGTFPVNWRTVGGALRTGFGIKWEIYDKAEEVIPKIEEQARLRERVREVIQNVPSGRIQAFDPRYGVIIGKHFYPVSHPDKKLYLEPEFRSIRRLVFSIYGNDVPEKPDIYNDYYDPPWTARRFGEVRLAYLIDEDPGRDLYVYLENEEYYLDVGKKTFRLGRREKRPNVREAFRKIFNMELTPEMTREDVEAIAAMAALGGR